MGKSRAFTAEERSYLLSLAAVDSVDRASRVHYADRFRDECMRRYHAGEKPTVLFREAGLDPKLVGWKRIERAFANWRRMELAAPTRTTPEPPEPDPPEPDSRDKLISE